MSKGAMGVLEEECFQPRGQPVQMAWVWLKQNEPGAGGDEGREVEWGWLSL